MFKEIGSRKEAVRLGMAYLDRFMKQHGLALVFEENYKYGAAKMVGACCVIDVSVDRYDTGVSIYIVDPQTHNKYWYGDILKRKNAFKVGTREFKIKTKTLAWKASVNEEIYLTLKNLEQQMNTYCSDILSGDFSSLSDLKICD